MLSASFTESGYETFCKLESVIEIYIYILLFISVLVVLTPGDYYHFNHDVLTFGEIEVVSGKSEKAMVPHSSTLAWKIPQTEEPGGLQSMGSLRVGHD